MRKADKVGFAVIGLGAISRTCVLPAFRNARRARLVGLVSRDKRKAATWARRYGAEYAYASQDFASCLANPRIEAIYVATPPGEHKSFVVAGANAGKHVLCEKPLAADAQQAAEMVETCRSKGVLLMTAYRKHFEASALALKDLIQSGRLGDIDLIHSSFNELHVSGKSLPWLLDRHLAGGGPLMDLGVYCVNTTRWLLQEDPVEALASSWKRDANRFVQVEEGISFRLRFPSGCYLQASSTYSSALSSFMFVHGTKGWACLTPAFPFDEQRCLTGKIRGKSFEHKFKIVDEFAPQLDALAIAIRRRTPVSPDGEQGRRDLQIIQAIYESARAGTPIRIAY